MKKKEVYLDHAATTYVDPRVTAEMEPYFTVEYGNPSSLYRLGRRAKEAIDGARTRIAKILHSKADEIIFTGSGTESDNLAIFGILRMNALPGEKKGHIVTSVIEHHAVLHAVEALEKEGFEITKVPVSEEGLVDAESIRKALRPDTILVSIMYANNEIGTIQPIAEIGQMIRAYRLEKIKIPPVPGDPGAKWPYFHTDACQAAGALNLDTNVLGVDLMTLNGSKIYGPKGVGVLYAKTGIRLKPIAYGGGQEKNLRSGTENVPYIVGMAKALEIADGERGEESARLIGLRDYFIEELQKRIPKVVLNGHATKRLPNNINVSFLDVEGEAVLLYLDNEGISISTGSACTSTTLDPSHVILALGVPYEYAHGSIRFTLGRKTTKGDLDYVLDVLPRVIERLREISPVRLEIGQKQISHPEAFAGQGSKVKVGGKTYK